MNIKLVLADSNEKYVKRLFTVLSEDSRFSVFLFTDKKAMVESLSQKKYDVVLMDKSMADVAVENVPAVVLMVDDDEMDGVEQLGKYKKINKYQCVSKIVSMIIDIYSELTPNVGFYNAKTIKALSVYSPAGGCGKTTVAMSFALAASHQGIRTIYIDFEEYSSILSLFGKMEGKGLSELFAKIDSDINFSAKLQSLMHDFDGVRYFNGFDNPRDFSEITADNIKKLLDIIAQANLCELVIFDLPSIATPVVKAVMEQSDKVILVAGKGITAQEKLKQLLSQIEFMDTFAEKLAIVCNRAGNISFAGVNTLAAIEEFKTGTAMDICRYVSAGGYIKINEYLK